MAVRFSATGQSYSSTASLPSPATGYTVTFWAKLASDRNAISSFFGLAGSPANHAYRTQADGTTLEYAPAGTAFNSISVGVWYRFAVIFTAPSGGFNTANIYFGTATASSLTSGSYGVTQVTAWTSLRIGTDIAAPTTNWLDGAMAAFKMYGAVLTVAQVERELKSYMPYRTANLLRLHPFDKPDLNDYSGMGGTLTGGTGAVIEPGPPIPWRAARTPFLAPDPVAVPWYAVYVTATGELFSIGDVYELQPDQSVKTYYGPPVDLQAYEWSPTALDFVTRAGYDQIDRVADLVADPTLTSAWAALSGPQSTAMQDRIGQMLGPYRYRDSAQPVDL